MRKSWLLNCFGHCDYRFQELSKYIAGIQITTQLTLYLAVTITQLYKTNYTLADNKHSQNLVLHIIGYAKNKKKWIKNFNISTCPTSVSTN